MSESTRDLILFEADFARPLGELVSPPEVLEWLAGRGEPGVSGGGTEAVNKAVRTMLREGGFKPSGRSKPASEYLQRAVQEGALSSINLAVDLCNVVSYHSGLPISVVDLDRAQAPFSVAVCPEGASTEKSSYVFNSSGQSIDLAGLLCLHDAQGPCANAVKDSQRTKTSASTTRTLVVIWGSNQLPGHTAKTFGWYKQLLEQYSGKGSAAVRVLI